METQRQITYYFTYMWNLKKKMSKQNNTETDSQTQNQRVAAGGGKGMEELSETC